MSGIVAVFCRDSRPAEVDAAQKAIAAIADGGQFSNKSSLPKTSGNLWSDQSIALATSGTCPRTSIATKVLQSRCKRFRLVADVRLDNIPELADVLGHPPDRFDTDAEWVLAAYERWEVTCVEHLLGDFVFAIWDTLRHELVCARDHLGSRSLHIHVTETLCVLASRLNGLMASELVPRTVNSQRIVDCLVEPLEAADYTSTFYKQAQRIPPAHVITIGRDKKVATKYWSLANAPETNESKESSWLDGIHHHMKNSVARRLVGGANVGSMLSGGMDSSSIVALAREIRLATGTSSDTGVIPLPTISFAFDDDCESTDSKHSRELAAMNGLRAERIGAGDIADDRVAQLFCTAPTSPFDAFMHLAAFVYRRAQLCGLSTVLDGIDGDLVFGIHAPYVPGLIRSGRLITFAKEVYRSNQRKSGSLATFGRNMVSNSLNALPQRLHVWRRGRMVRDASQLCADSIVRREFAVQHGVVERMAQLRQFTAVTDDFRQNHVAWMEHPFATVGMERYERLATSFGIRPQHPLYDVQLLEYCVNLPWNLRTRNGWSKYGMRKAMSQSLSNATCWRCEYDNLYPRVAIRFLNLHRELLEDFVQSGLHQHDCILDVGRIRQSMSDFAGGNSRAGMDVWQAFYLSKWLESA